MICTTDPVEVFRLLEQHDEAGFNPSQNHASVFQCNQYFAVLVFCCYGTLKGPRLYLFPKPWHYSEIRDTFFSEISKLAGDEHFENAKSLALQTVNAHYETYSASNFFFDAH